MDTLRQLRVALAGLLAVAAPASGQAISLAGPSTSWTSLGATYDYLSHQQTGQPASDIVGTGSDPGFFTASDYGSSNTLGIYAPESGLNISPNTTTIDSTPYASYVISPSNFNYRVVDFLSDGGTTNDLTTASSGDPDWYASFLVPFNDVVTYLGGLSSPIAIDDTTAMRYIVATSTQVNSLNQDIGGIDGGTNSTTPFVETGSFTPPVDAGGSPVPEPATTGSIALALLLLLGRRRNR